MDLLNIIILVLLCLIGYICFINYFNSSIEYNEYDIVERKENFIDPDNIIQPHIGIDLPTKLKKKIKYNRDASIENISPNCLIDSCLINSVDDNIYSECEGKVNPYFVDIQFHNDYRDVMTAINNIVSSKNPKLHKFDNCPNTFQKTKIDICEVADMIADFIDALNENIVIYVPQYRNKNSGWDEMVPDMNMESGFDRVQRKIGAFPKLYDDPALKNCVKLININGATKYIQDDFTKYECEIVIQKNNVNDQMIIKIDFVLLNGQYPNPEKDINVIIENIFTIGYLSLYGSDIVFDDDMTKFCNFEELDKYGITSDDKIQQIFAEKIIKKQKEEELIRNRLGFKLDL